MIVTDKAHSYRRVIREINRHYDPHFDSIRHIDRKWRNNLIESDHAALKRLLGYRQSFRSLRSAKATLSGIETIRTIKRDHIHHMRVELCCDALTMALGRRSPVPGLIHHSDRGSQYACGEYRKLIKKAGLTQSMSRKGQCLDNAPMESFFASSKKELVHRQWFKTRAQARAAIFEYIEVFYNWQRRHSWIGCQTPQQAFNNMTWKMAA